MRHQWIATSDDQAWGPFSNQAEAERWIVSHHPDATATWIRPPDQGNDLTRSQDRGAGDAGN